MNSCGPKFGVMFHVTVCYHFDLLSLDSDCSLILYTCLVSIEGQCFVIEDTQFYILLKIKWYIAFLSNLF